MAYEMLLNHHSKASEYIFIYLLFCHIAIIYLALIQFVQHLFNVIIPLRNTFLTASLTPQLYQYAL